MCTGLPSIEQLQQILQQILTPQGNDDLQKGTAYLRNYMKIHHSVPVLFQFLRSCPQIEVRQLVGVLLRRSISGHWIKLNGDLKNELKTVILMILPSEPERLVRLTIANLVCIIARLVINSSETWDALLPSLFNLSSSQVPEHREAALIVFDSLFQEQGEHFKECLPRLSEVLHRSLNLEENIKIRSATIKATGSVFSCLESEEDSNRFKSLIPLMLNSITQFIQKGNNDEAIEGLSVFDDLVEMSGSVLKDSIPLLVHFVLEVGQTKTIDLSVRQEALTIIQWLAQYKPKFLKANFISPIMKLVFQLCAEPEPEGTDEWDYTAHKFGILVLDKMACHVSAKKIFSESMAYISKFIESPNENERKAAMGALMILPRGCADLMIGCLESLVPYLFKGMNDPSQLVREVSCLTLGQFSEHLQPNIVKYYKDILPLIFKAMNDQRLVVQERSCYSLVAFLQCAAANEMLGEEIGPYMEPLMNRLIALLRTSPEKDVQEMALSGISATAQCAGKAFLPWLLGVIEMIKELMLITDQKTIELRCRAIECAGFLASSLGKDHFLPYLNYFMEHARIGLITPGLEELRDYTFSFFASIAEALGPDFKDHLPTVMPLIIAGCESTDGISVHPEAALDAIFEGQDQIEEDDKPDTNNYSVSQSFVDEKTQALHTLSLLAYSSGENFMPYLDRCTKCVLLLMRNVHPLVRKATFPAAESFIVTTHKTYPPSTGPTWKPGVPAKEQPLSERTRIVLDSFLSIYLKTILTDNDKAVACAACDSLRQVIKVLGPASIEDQLPELSQVLMAVLLGTTTCQTLYQDEEEEEGIFDEDEEEQDNIDLFQTACELVGQVAKTLKARFSQVQFEFIDVLSQYVKPNIDGFIKHEAMGTIAEILEGLGSLASPHFDKLMELCLSAMKDSHPLTQNNGTYCCGVLCAACPDLSVKYFNQIFQILPPLLKLQHPKYPELKDNACGVIARIITSSAASVPLPLEQLLTALFASLPLQKDFEENKSVYAAIIYLYQNQNPAILPFIPNIIKLFSGELLNKHVQPEVKQNMAQLLKHIHSQFSQQFTSIVNTLSPPQQQALSQIQ